MATKTLCRHARTRSSTTFTEQNYSRPRLRPKVSVRRFCRKPTDVSRGFRFVCILYSQFSFLGPPPLVPHSPGSESFIFIVPRINITLGSVCHKKKMYIHTGLSRTPYECDFIYYWVTNRVYNRPSGHAPRFETDGV